MVNGFIKIIKNMNAACQLKKKKKKKKQKKKKSNLN